NLELARQHGQALASAVEAALLPKPRSVHGPLRLALEEATLDFVPPPGRDALLKQLESTDPRDQRRAKHFLAELEKHGKIRSTYAYPVQVIQFGHDLTLVALAGEVVVDYAHRLK